MKEEKLKFAMSMATGIVLGYAFASLTKISTDEDNKELVKRNVLAIKDKATEQIKNAKKSVRPSKTYQEEVSELGSKFVEQLKELSDNKEV